jgi:hypothetical protein
MKILHLALASHFTVGMLYQENQMIECQRADGHEVWIITDCWRYEQGELVKGPEEDTIMDNGARLIRLELDRVMCSELWTEKTQKCDRVKGLIEEFAPDTILFHGMSGYEIMTAAEYCKNHPNCLLFMDCHEDYSNSARNIISKTFYKVVHGHFISKAMPEIDKVLYIGADMRNWMNDLYVIPKEKQEFMAPGGTIYSLEQQKNARMEIIRKYALPQDAIILAHSGKLAAPKRTAELLRAFHKVNDPRLALFIFGSIPDDMEPVLRPLMEMDNRVHFMGWKVNKEIEEFLAGVDMYCQPGSQSSTFETAMCAGCVNMAYPFDSYTDENYTDCNFENYFFVETEEDIEKVFRDITDNVQVLEQAKAKSFSFARLNFDYAVISRRIYTL